MSDIEIEYPYLLLPDVSHVGDSAMLMTQLLPYCVTDPLMSGVNIKTRLYAEATKAVLDHLQRKGIRVQRYVWISEVWISETRGVQPSCDPNRTVGLAVQMFHRGQSSVIVYTWAVLETAGVRSLVRPPYQDSFTVSSELVIS